MTRPNEGRVMHHAETRISEVNVQKRRPQAPAVILTLANARDARDIGTPTNQSINPVWKRDRERERPVIFRR